MTRIEQSSLFVCLFVRGAGLRSETQISLLPTHPCRLQDLGQRHLSDYEQLQEPYPPPQSLPHRRDQNGSSCIAVITSQVLSSLEGGFLVRAIKSFFTLQWSAAVFIAGHALIKVLRLPITGITRGVTPASTGW